MINALRIPRGTIDFETRSFLDVRNVGAWPYAEHETTEILCMSTRLPRTEPNLWVPGLEIPGGLIRYIESDGLFEAHNAQFERAVWLRIMLEKMGYPMPKRWMDTMAVCAYKALPLSLDAVGEVLNLNVKKDKRGKYLLDKLSKPRKPTKKDPRIWIDDFDLYEELYDYCDRDTASEEDLSITIGDLPPPEYKIWVLDQKINQRGVYLDMEAVNAAKIVCQQIEEKWNAELFEVTDGAVEKGTQVARLKKWCGEQGVELGSLGKDILKDMLKDDEKREFLPPQVRRALQIRLELGMASTAKINKFLETVCNDGKARGLLQYHGAGTGRWAGRGAQPHNVPRGITKPKDYVHHLLGTTSPVYGTIDEKDYDAARSEELIADIKLMDSDYLEIKYGTAMGAVSSALRGMMTASPGNRLMVADFSAIEAVVLAWVCGEESKLDVFRNKLDPYCETASGIFGFKVDKEIAKDPSHPEFKKHADARQTGKTCELAFGYQGGVGAWRNFDRTDSKTDDEINETKDTWRANHLNIQDAWYGFERSAINAVQTGKPHHYNGITFGTVTDKAGNWMYIQLPNGRKLWYYDPALHDDTTPWGKPCKKLTYQGKDNNRGGAWGRVETYGGKLCLAPDTQVLTGRGWVELIDIEFDDHVWDGVEWVSHDGCEYQGEKETIELNGVRMTLDHEVMTDEGWVKAADCDVHRAFSVCEALGGIPEWGPGCDEIPGLELSTRSPVGMPMRVREFDQSCSQRLGKAGRDILRMQSSGEQADCKQKDRRQAPQTRNVKASSFLRMEVNARPLQTADSSGVEKLRRAWDSCVRTMAKVREFLGGHGPNVPERVVSGPQGQRCGILQKELQMGDRKAAGQQSSGPTESVYDIINAGPRRRFMIKTNDGVMIVHNCENIVQAIARDLMVEGMIQVEILGYKIILTVHDEIIADVPFGFGSQKEFEEAMAYVPPWAKGCPVAVDGWTGHRYRK